MTWLLDFCQCLKAVSTKKLLSVSTVLLLRIKTEIQQDFQTQRKSKEHFC